VLGKRRACGDSRYFRTGIARRLTNIGLDGIINFAVDPADNQKMPALAPTVSPTVAPNVSPTVVPTPVHLASPAVSPASPQHLEQIAAARAMGKKIRRAASVATTSGWTMGVFGGLTLITSLFDITGLLLGAGMCVLAHYELRGAKMLRRLDLETPKKLARNQVIFGVLLILYAGIAMWTSLSGPSEIDKAVGNDPQVAQMMGSFGSLEKTMYIGVYTAMIFAAIVGCGGTAWYYSTRRTQMENYLRQAAPWIIELQRAGMSV
jgi:hypothetical protein